MTTRGIPKSRPRLPTVKPKPGAKRGRGRPALAITDDLKLRVEEMVAVGMTHKEIGAAIGVSDDWLQGKMKDSIANGGARRRAELTHLAFEAARGGNIAAIKHLDLKTSAAAAEREFVTPEAPTRKLGKKEQQQQDALTAGSDSDWGNLLHTGQDQEQAKH